MCLTKLPQESGWLYGRQIGAYRAANMQIIIIIVSEKKCCHLRHTDKWQKEKNI